MALHGAILRAQLRPSMLKVQSWQRPSSAPAPPQGVPGGSGWLSTPRGEAGPLGTQPLPRMLAPAASKAADFSAFHHPGVTYMVMFHMLTSTCLLAFLLPTKLPTRRHLHGHVLPADAADADLPRSRALPDRPAQRGAPTPNPTLTTHHSPLTTRPSPSPLNLHPHTSPSPSPNPSPNPNPNQVPAVLKMILGPPMAALADRHDRYPRYIDRTYHLGTPYICVWVVRDPASRDRVACEPCSA